MFGSIRSNLGPINIDKPFDAILQCLILSIGSQSDKKLELPFNPLDLDIIYNKDLHEAYNRF